MRACLELRPSRRRRCDVPRLPPTTSARPNSWTMMEQRAAERLPLAVELGLHPGRVLRACFAGARRAYPRPSLPPGSLRSDPIRWHLRVEIGVSRPRFGPVLIGECGESCARGRGTHIDRNFGPVSAGNREKKVGPTSKARSTHLGPRSSRAGVPRGAGATPAARSRSWSSWRLPTRRGATPTSWRASGGPSGNVVRASPRTSTYASSDEG